MTNLDATELQPEGDKNVEGVLTHIEPTAIEDTRTTDGISSTSKLSGLAALGAAGLVTLTQLTSAFGQEKPTEATVAAVSTSPVNTATTNSATPAPAPEAPSTSLFVGANVTSDFYDKKNLGGSLLFTLSFPTSVEWLGVGSTLGLSASRGQEFEGVRTPTYIADLSVGPVAFSGKWFGFLYAGGGVVTTGKEYTEGFGEVIAGGGMMLGARTYVLAEGIGFRTQSGINGAIPSIGLGVVAF